VCYRKLQAMSKTRGSNSHRIFGLLWIIILISAGNVSADQQSPPPISAAPVTINLTHKSVHPQAINVLAGSQVIFENDDLQDLTLLLRSQSGTAMARLVVNSQGQVVSAQIAQSSGWPDVDDKIIQAAKAKTFSPTAGSGTRSYLLSYEFGSPSAQSEGGPFAEVVIKAGGTFNYTFTTPGEYFYYLAPSATLGVTVFVSASK
jgi:TonB family protein